jgi:hypothetical protein
MDSDATLEGQDNQSLPPEYGPNVLVVMARGRQEGLWRPAGGPVDAASLGLAPALADRLAQWSRAFTEATRDETDPHRMQVLATFGHEGLRLAREVQDCLGPSYEILFFDEARLEEDGYLTEYLYAVVDAPAASG